MAPMMTPPLDLPAPGSIAYMDFTADRMAGLNISLSSDAFTLDRSG